MSKNKVKIGLVGFGVVGSGVVKILLENADSIEKKNWFASRTFAYCRPGHHL